MTAHLGGAADAPPRWLGPVSVGLLAAAAALWGASLAATDRGGLSALGDLGLVELLPWTYYAALAALLVGFAVVLRSPRPGTLLASGYVAVLIAVLHATPAVLYGTPRYPFTYKHIGVASYVQEHGTVDPAIDAYFNWPGFFALNAFTAELGGVESTFGLSVWAPALMNVLLSVGVLALMIGLGATRQAGWLGLWVFLLANWVGQDYFAPQALAMVFHLVILGAYLAWFGRDSAPLDRSQTSNLRVLTLLFLALAFAGVVAAHQLTPFMTLASVVALVVARRARAPWLAVVMGTLLVMWFVYSAHTYFAGHLGELAAAVGRLVENLSVASEVITAAGAGVVSAERALVLTVRQALVVVVALLALVGAVRQARAKRFAWSAALLAVLPAGLVALQPYGGEIIMRIYMFSLPFLAFFAAAALFPRVSPTGWGTSLGVLASTTLLAAGMLIAYFGNESMNYIAPEEVAALELLYDTAPTGALVLTPTDNPPVRHRRYDELRYDDLVKLMGPRGESPVSVEAVVALLEEVPDADLYILVSRSQAANARLFGRLPGFQLDELAAALGQHPDFDTLVEAEGAALFARRALGSP